MNADYQNAEWYVLTLVMPADISEELLDELREYTDRDLVQLAQPESEHTWVELYFDQLAAAKEAQAACQDWPFPIHATAVRHCRSRDWEAFWKLHFKSRPIGDRLFVIPDWESRPSHANDRCLLRIVPGLSFGTGEHFTTRFCLEMIDRLAPPSGPCHTMWDVGCGSGLLGVAGAVLGMREVVGTDNDPICLSQSADNAELNGVAQRTKWMTGDILGEESYGSFDLVCANLFASLLMQAAETLWQATGRYLALSGIREHEVDGVADTFLALGAREVVRDGDGEWAGLLFERVTQ